MIPAGTKVYFAVAPADLRKSFDGLSALALGELQKSPSEGGLFVFLNKRGDQVRVLFRDRHGCCVLAKRLDRGRFRRPRVKDGCFCWEVDATTLMTFLDDIDVARGRATRRPESVVRHLQIVKTSPQ
jgi:transposase